MKSSTKSDFPSIDTLQLDVACVEQPELMYEASIALAELKQQHAELKEQIRQREADVAQDVRAKPHNYGLDRATEKACAEIAMKDETLREMQEELNGLAFDIDKGAAMVTALSHRKSMIESLIYLHGQGYFAEVETSRPTAKPTNGTTRKSKRN